MVVPIIRYKNETQRVTRQSRFEAIRRHARYLIMLQDKSQGHHNTKEPRPRQDVALLLDGLVLTDICSD